VTTRPPVRERWILFPSDSVETIEKPVHGIGFHFIGLVARLLILLRIKTKYLQFDIHQKPLIEMPSLPALFTMTL
jgi:hypothetical protein